MNPMDMLKKASEAEAVMKQNHTNQIAALGRIEELLRKILFALGAEETKAEEVK